MKYFSFCVKFQQYVSTPSSSLEKTRGPWTWNRHTRIRNVGKSLRKSQVHLVFIVRVGGNLKERKPLCWGPGHTWNVADVALRITKALLNRTRFCTGGRSTVNLLNLYATMLRVDVEEEDCVLLGGLIPWNDLRWQEPHIDSCCTQPPTMILGACCRSSMYNSVVLAPLKSSPQWLDEFQSP